MKLKEVHNISEKLGSRRGKAPVHMIRKNNDLTILRMWFCLIGFGSALMMDVFGWLKTDFDILLECVLSDYGGNPTAQSSWPSAS